jgi:hypothetical protein
VGVVSKVEFYDGATLKGTATTSPYAYTWPITATDNGSHSWTAKAYDALNNYASSAAVSLSVNIPAPDTTPPTTTSNAPTAWVATDVNVTLTATDGTGSGVASTQYCTDIAGTCTPLTTGPVPTITCPAGTACQTYVRFRSTDIAVNVETIKSALVRIDKAAPSASIGSPASGTSYTSAQSVTITAAASDNQGVGVVSKVEFYDGATLKGTATTSPYAYTWPITATDNGSHSWTAKAYDALNNYASSSPVSLSVNITAAAGTGATRWVEHFGGSGSSSIVQAAGIAVDRNGDIIVAGSFTGTVNLGGAALTAAGFNNNIFVAKYSAAGQHIWSKRFGDANVDQAKGVAVDPVTGNIAVVGSFQGTLDFGSGAMTAANAGGALYDDAFVAVLAPDGTSRWSKRFGSTVEDSANAVAVDSQGNIVVVGRYRLLVNFGGSDLQSYNNTQDIFVAKFSSAGTHLWSMGFGNLYPDEANGVAVDPSDNVIVTGSYRGNVNFGGGGLTSYYIDGFVAKYSPSGAHIWSKRLGGTTTTSDYGDAVATDTNGNVFVTGQSGGSVDFGGGALTSLGGLDVFLVKYSPLGVHQWSTIMGGPNSDEVFGIATDSSGNVMVTGGYSGAANFGAGSLTSSGSSWDIFVAKYSANGAAIWAKSFGGGTTDLGAGVATDSSGNVLVTGAFQITSDFGGVPMTATGVTDMFMLNLSP